MKYHAGYVKTNVVDGKIHKKINIEINDYHLDVYYSFVNMGILSKKRLYFVLEENFSCAKLFSRKI